MRVLDLTTSFLSTLARAAAGMQVTALGPRPDRPLELYDFEACPFCRKVREACSLLDLEVLVHPCPQGGPRYRPWVVEYGGKRQFPFLRDPNMAVEMYESDDIVRYLFETYGAGPVPTLLATPLLRDATAFLASVPRAAHGRTYRPAHPPAEALHLWSFEASPYCRLVRETLCELELSYHLHNVAKGSPSRDAFVTRSGRMMVPYLEDPNTGARLFESADICAYLNATYAR